MIIINKIAVRSDSLGTLASGLCMLHCLTTPLLFMIHPISAHVETTLVWWKSLDYVFLFVSFFAVYWSSKNSSKKGVKYVLWISWIALTLAILNEKMELFYLGELVIYIPALSLFFTHVHNGRYCGCNNKTCCTNE